jgi:hypothetical protein
MNRKLLFLIITTAALIAVFITFQIAYTGSLAQTVKAADWTNITLAALAITASAIGMTYFITNKQQPQLTPAPPKLEKPEKKTQQEKECEQIMDHIKETIPPIEEAIAVEETEPEHQENNGELKQVIEWKGPLRMAKASEVYKNSQILIHTALRDKIIKDIREGKLKIKPSQEALKKLGLGEMQITLAEATQNENKPQNPSEENASAITDVSEEELKEEEEALRKNGKHLEL